MVLYLSATGDTKYVAELLAKKLGDESLDLIKRIRNNDNSVIRSKKPFVICAPIYVSYIPIFLKDFLSRQKFAGNRKVYFVFTSGGGHSGAAGAAAENIVRRKNMLFMGYADVAMPNNYMALKFIPAPSEEKINALLNDARYTILRTAHAIAQGKKIRTRHITYAESLATKALADFWKKHMQPSKAFYTTDKCIGCGKCVSVCPLNNIVLDNGRPVWKASCAHCMACIGNCPVEAIEYGSITQTKPKYNVRKYTGKNSNSSGTALLRRSGFVSLRPVDNFYQSSLFFPMPVVLVSTLTDDGKTTCGPYSLIAPFYVAGKDYYAFMLECRNSSNTAQNLIKNKKCVINFLPDDGGIFKECVRLGWPGDTPAEKMKDFAFHLEEGHRKAEDPAGAYPKVISEAVQAVECTWVDTLDGAQDDMPLAENADHYELEKYHDFNGITSPYGAHFVLKIEKILMKQKYRDAVVNGVRPADFPPLPVDYGYRDSKNFWYHKHSRMIPELLPQRQTTLSSVRYAADRLQTDVTFTDAALERIANVPRIFLPTVLKGCVKWAEENNVKVIDVKEMEIINDKRSKEKS